VQLRRGWDSLSGETFSLASLKFGKALLRHPVEARATIQYVSFVIQNKWRGRVAGCGTDRSGALT